MSEPLPLHGIHYWEFKIKVSPKEEGPQQNQTEEQKTKEVEQTARSLLPQVSHSGGFVNFRSSQGASVRRSMEPKHFFVGLCQVNENHSMEDTHKSQNSVMLNLLDSSVWTNGSQVFNSSNKNVKIENPFEKIRETGEEQETQTIRVAIDLRFANNFESFWNEEENQLN